MIEVTHLTKTYGKKQNVFTALDDISLRIPRNASVAIVGKSGSGKSTLMHAISGLDRPQTGQVLIDGEDILRLSRRRMDAFRAHTMGFIFQSFFVEAGETCYNNVSLSLETAGVPRRQRKQRITAALEAVGLDDKVYSKAGNLSGGQKQRLAIARAIAGEPKILFADEPTGNLDSGTSQVVEDMLFAYQKQHQATMIIVTHDEDLAQRCDMQIHIKDGRVARITPEKHAPPRRRVQQSGQGVGSAQHTPATQRHTTAAAQAATHKHHKENAS